MVSAVQSNARRRIRFQPAHAELLSEFIPANQIIPTTEGVLRIFDRYGERAKRLKARMKFLIKDIGRDEFILVDEEKSSLVVSNIEIDTRLLMFPETLLEVPK
jgi:sulfite reductase (ferredoxin)